MGRQSLLTESRHRAIFAERDAFGQLGGAKGGSVQSERVAPAYSDATVIIPVS